MKNNRNKRICQNDSANGLTLVEVLVSIAVVAVLAALLIPAFSKAKPRSKAINCVSSLKHVGLAFRMWSNENGEQFPWNVSRTNGGTLEFAGRPEVFRHFLAVSNELTSPRVLTCQSDKRRTRISSWDQLTGDSRHVSYFLGLDADRTKPQSILTGDRNLTTNGVRAVGLVAIPMSTTVGWGPELHNALGNVGLADGSAHQMRSHTGAGSMRLVIP